MSVLAHQKESARAGDAVFNTIVAIVCNRTGRGYHTAFNTVLSLHSDLMEDGYDNLHQVQNFTRLLNRVENRSGLSAVAATERSMGDVATLVNRFAPSFSTATTALQWEVLWRAAEALDHAGVSEKMLNRDIPTDISKSDWKRANAQSEDVFTLLDMEASRPIDRGARLQYASASQVRGVFRSAIFRLMREQKLKRREAFDRLKQDEPIFWTMAMLSFEPDQQ